MKDSRIASRVFGSFSFLLLFLAGLDLFLRARPHLWLETSCNPGIGLGILLPPVVLWVGSGCFLLLALYQWLFTSESLEWMSWSLVFVGGLVNSLDRLSRGCVLDYLQVPFFPSFNMADIMLSLGVVLLFALYTGISPKLMAYVR